MEGELTDNIHNTRGSAKHERVDRVAHEVTREGAGIDYALPAAVAQQHPPGAAAALARPRDFSYNRAKPAPDWSPEGSP